MLSTSKSERERIMDKYYKCDCCDYVMREDEIETVNDTSGASDGTLDICPECRTPESYTLVEAS